MRWTNNSEQHRYMRERQAQNLARFSAAEEWAWKRIKTLRMYNWKRQHIWGVRIFDFFSIRAGIAIEIDGPEHREEYDSVRDRYNYLRSGILVLRVRNFNEDDLSEAINEVLKGETRKQRRKRVRAELGLPENAPMLDAVSAGGMRKAHCSWKPKDIDHAGI